MKKVKTIFVLLLALAGMFSASACSNADRQEKSSRSLASAYALSCEKYPFKI